MYVTEKDLYLDRIILWQITFVRMPVIIIVTTWSESNDNNAVIAFELKWTVKLDFLN